MRHERPSFDDLEPPEILTSPIDGLTDAQWSRRHERRERLVRAACGIVFGLFFGALAVTRLSPAAPHYLLGSWLVMGGSILLFVTLLVRRKDARVPHYALWVVFPEWKIVESLPVWLIALIALAAIAVLAFVAALAVIGFFPAEFR